MDLGPPPDDLPELLQELEHIAKKPIGQGHRVPHQSTQELIDRLSKAVGLSASFRRIWEKHYSPIKGLDMESQKFLGEALEAITNVTWDLTGHIIDLQNELTLANQDYQTIYTEYLMSEACQKEATKQLDGCLAHISKMKSSST